MYWSILRVVHYGFFFFTDSPSVLHWYRTHTDTHVVHTHTCTRSLVCVLILPHFTLVILIIELSVCCNPSVVSTRFKELQIKHRRNSTPTLKGGVSEYTLNLLSRPFVNRVTDRV